MTALGFQPLHSMAHRALEAAASAAAGIASAAGIRGGSATAAGRRGQRGEANGVRPGVEIVDMLVADGVRIVSCCVVQHGIEYNNAT